MVATAKFNVDHLGNVGVWIDMATSYQGQRLKGYLTVIQMVRVCFCKVIEGILLIIFSSRIAASFDSFSTT